MDVQSKIEEALRQGYSMDEINSYLSQNNIQTSNPQPSPIPTVSNQPTPTPIEGILPTINQNTQTTPSYQEPDLATKVGQGVLGFLHGLASPFTKFAGQVQQDAAQLKALAQKNPKAAQQEYQKNYAPNPAGPLVGGIMDLINGKKITRQALAPTLNAVSYAVPFGAGGNIFTKAVLPGAAVGGLQSASQGNNPTQIVGNAAMGAAGAGALGAVAPIVSKVLGIGGQGAEAASNEFLKGQYKAPASDLQKYALGQTVKDMGRYNINSLDQVQKMAPQITGESGLITKLTRDAVAKSSPVNLGIMNGQARSTVGDIADNLINQETALSPSIETKVRNTITKIISNIPQITKNTGIIDASGKLVPTGIKTVGADPEETFQAIKTLEQQAAKYKYSNNNDANALVNIYKGVANELKDRLFQGPGGADSQIAKNVITDSVINDAKNIHPQLAADLQKIRDSGGSTGEMRSLAAPFVRGQILAGKTLDNASNAIISQKDMLGAAAGALIGGGPGALTGLALEKAANSGVVKGAIGGGLRTVGNASANAGQVISNVGNNSLVQSILGQIGGRTPALMSKAASTQGTFGANEISFSSAQNPNNSTNNINANNVNQSNQTISQISGNVKPSDVISGKAPLPATLPDLSTVVNLIPNQPYSPEKQMADMQKYLTDLQNAGNNPIAIGKVNDEKAYIDAMSAKNKAYTDQYISSHPISPELKASMDQAPQTYDILNNVKSLVAAKNGTSILQAALNDLDKVNYVRFQTDPDYANMITQLKALNSAIAYDQVHGRLSNFDLTQLRQLPARGDVRATALKLVDQAQRNLYGQYVRNLPRYGLTASQGGGQPIPQGIQQLGIGQ